MKHKVSELDGFRLDCAVVLSEGTKDFALSGGGDYGPARLTRAGKDFRPSVDWADGGQIIERERIAVAPWDGSDDEPACWKAAHVDGSGYFASVEFRHSGPTPLVAAMRAYVSSKLGAEVELP